MRHFSDMAIYLVTPLAHNVDAVGAAINSHFQPANWLELQGRAGWFVSYPGTSVELSRELGVTPADGKSLLGSVLITSVGSYYGRGPTPMWEWLKTRFESQK